MLTVARTPIGGKPTSRRRTRSHDAGHSTIPRPPGLSRRSNPKKTSKSSEQNNESQYGLEIVRYQYDPSVYTSTDLHESSGSMDTRFLSPEETELALCRARNIAQTMGKDLFTWTPDSEYSARGRPEPALDKGIRVRSILAYSA